MGLSPRGCAPVTTVSPERFSRPPLGPIPALCKFFKLLELQPSAKSASSVDFLRARRADFLRETQPSLATPPIAAPPVGLSISAVGTYLQGSPRGIAHAPGEAAARPVRKAATASTQRSCPRVRMINRRPGRRLRRKRRPAFRPAFVHRNPIRYFLSFF